MPLLTPLTLPAPPRVVLIDLAGVLHVGDQAIPGAVDALARLRAAGLPLRFLTNTTRAPRQAIVDLLRGLGFDVRPDEVHTAALATRQLVRTRGLRPHWLVHPDIVTELGASDPNPNVVVMGDAGPHFTFDGLNYAFRLLMNGLPLIAMARNRYFKEPDGLTLDLGAFVAALEYGAGVTAEIVGKPAASFFLGPLASAISRPACEVRLLHRFGRPETSLARSSTAAAGKTTRAASAPPPVTRDRRSRTPYPKYSGGTTTRGQTARISA